MTTYPICVNSEPNVFNASEGPDPYNGSYYRLNRMDGVTEVPCFVEAQDEDPVHEVNGRSFGTDPLQSTKSKFYVTYHDARVLDPRRNILQKFDRVPGISEYDNSQSYKTSGYRGYDSIQLGDIEYYVDNELKDPYFNPVFTLGSDVEQSVFIDPMGSHKSQYERVPKSKTLLHVSDYQSTRDQLAFREDLISRQMAIPNQQRFSSFYFF